MKTVGGTRRDRCGLLWRIDHGPARRCGSTRSGRRGISRCRPVRYLTANRLVFISFVTSPGADRPGIDLAQKASGEERPKEMGMAHGRQRGFTIIEILIVMIVIGIVASFVAPRINLARYQVESGMLGVGTTLIAAQRLSVLRGYDVIIGFDVADASVRVHEDSNGNGLIDAGERVRGMPLGEHVVFGRGSAPAFDIGAGPVTFTDIHDGLPCLVFHRNGSANQAQGFYLTSEREVLHGGHPEDSRAVVIDRATGRVNWYRYGAPTWRRGF